MTFLDSSPELFDTVLQTLTGQQNVQAKHGFDIVYHNALQGHALEKLIAARSQSQDETERVVAQVHIWNDHAHLLQLVKDAMQM